MEFKLCKFDKINSIRQVSIGNFINKKHKFSHTSHHIFLKKEWENWIEKINDLRNEVIHKSIINQSEGIFKVHARIINDKLVKDEKKILSIQKYNIENLEEFVLKTIENLDDFIINFFDCLDSKKIEN